MGPRPDPIPFLGVTEHKLPATGGGQHYRAHDLLDALCSGHPGEPARRSGPAGGHLQCGCSGARTCADQTCTRAVCASSSRQLVQPSCVVSQHPCTWLASPSPVTWPGPLLSVLQAPSAAIAARLISTTAAILLAPADQLVQGLHPLRTSLRSTLAAATLDIWS